jgi:hypothetical protein
LNFAFYDAANDGIKKHIMSSGDIMLRTWVDTLCHLAAGQAPRSKGILPKWIRTLALIILGALPPSISAMTRSEDQHPKGAQGTWQNGEKKMPPPGDWHEGGPKWQGWGGWQGDKKWPTPSELLDWTAKRLEQMKSSNQTGSEIKWLQSKTSDLLERSKSAKENPFRFDRLINAANALLNTGDSISQARKMDKIPQEKDFWGFVGMAIQGCYFRVQQADSFAKFSGEKNSEQYVTLARTLYQQSRGAYDARDYLKAKLLADASGSIVFALESITQAAWTPPETHIPK